MSQIRNETSFYRPEDFDGVSNPFTEAPKASNVPWTPRFYNSWTFNFLAVSNAKRKKHKKFKNFKIIYNPNSWNNLLVPTNA
jgi:hypothetical protein